MLKVLRGAVAPLASLVSSAMGVVDAERVSSFMPQMTKVGHYGCEQAEGFKDGTHSPAGFRGLELASVK